MKTPQPRDHAPPPAMDAGGADPDPKRLQEQLAGLEQRMAERTADLQRQAARHQALAEISKALMEAGPRYEKVLELLARRLVEVVGDCCIIRLVSEDGRSLQLAAVHHADPEILKELREQVAAPHGVDEGFTAEAVRTGEPVFFPNITREQLLKQSKPEQLPFVQKHPCYARMIVPMRMMGRVIGTLNLSRYVPGRSYDQDDLLVLQQAADRAALAITNARLFESQTHLAAAVEQTADSVLVTDAAGNIQYVNPAFERITGYTRAEVIGRNPRLLKSGEQDAQVYRDMWTTLKRGEVWIGRFVNKRKDGARFEVEATISPIRDATGRITSYVAVERDVTREVALEGQLRQAQKMEAVGRLAGGIAHDINNVLMIIRGHTDMAREQVSSADPLRRDLDQIQKASDRATALVQQLLAFGRRQLHRPRILDINMVVADLGKMLAPLIGEDIKLRIRTNAVRGHVKADPGQVEQVLMNLATNARDAMPRGGELVIETANADGTDEFALRALGARPGPWVRLAVSDTGCGMSAEVKSHLFEPFFTTKSPHKGSGLGLATVYGIIKQSGGHVWVESEVGRGTTFAIYLAQVEGVPEPAVARPSADAALRGSETILLVEDDDGVRQLVREMLVRAGYTVLEANYGEAALKVADEHQGQIHLLLTDVVMPGMSGRELADHLRARREGVKVCFMSGYPGAVLAQQGVLEPGTTLLQKPFVPAMLTGKLRELLDAPSAYR